MSRSVAVLVALALSAATAFAQDLTGVIRGTVRDEQRAVVPGATVSAIHTATNTQYTTTTSDTGTFVLSSVRLGTYTVTVTLPGFQNARVEDVRVEIGGTVSLNMVVSIAGRTETVVVTGPEVPIVNTIDAQLSAVVDEQRVEQLPLNGRNAAHLALMQAGVNFERSPDGQGDKLFVHGQRHRALNISLDGIDTQDNLNRASSIMLDQPLLALSAENVQEFRVITGLATAEHGRGGAQIQAVTRSGTNNLRGSLFEFHRNTAFNANDFFNKAATPAVPTPPLIRNQFGGRLGGRVVRDRTFFFLGYQQTREGRGLSVNRVVYTEEARRGIFRYLDGLRATPENVAANPHLIRSVDVMRCDAPVRTTLGRDCVDSRFTASRPASFDPFIRNTVFPAIPLPNNSDLGDGLNTAGYRFNADVQTEEHLPALRIDHRLGPRHLLYGTFNYIWRDIDGDYINGREPVYPTLGSLGSRITRSSGYSGSLQSTWSSLLNELRFGLLAGRNSFGVNQPFDQPFTLDLNTVVDPFDPSNNLEYRDNITAHLRDVVSWVRGQHSFRVGGEFRHRSVDTVGFDEVNPFGEIDLNFTDNPPGFSTTDLRRLSGGSNLLTTDFETSQGLMNNLVGAIGEVEMRYNVTSLTSGFVEGAPERRIFGNNEWDVFVQDTWVPRPGLTLNLGLRYEYATVPDETQGLALVPEHGFASVFGVSGETGFFKPSTLQGTPCPQLQSPRAPTSANAVDLITSCATKFVAGGATNGRPLWKPDRNNLAPVVGVAWDPKGNGRTAIRGGYRLSYMQEAFSIVDGNLDDNEGLRIDQDCIPIEGDCRSNPALLRDVTSPPIARPPSFSLPTTRTLLDNTAQDFRGYAESLRTAYYHEFSVGVQREIFANVSLEARYVGNRGRKLPRVADYNEINIGARDGATGATFLDSFVIAQRNLACNRARGAGDRFDDATGLPCVTPNPLMNVLIAGEPARLRNRTTMIQALERNAPAEFVYRLTQTETSSPSSGQPRIRGGSFFGAVLTGRLPVNFFQVNPFVGSARAMINDGESEYDALELEIRRRMSRGLTWQANYTYNRARADYDGDSNELLNDSRPSSVRNPRYTWQEFMPRHTVNVNYLYELPLPRRSGLVGALLSGWQTGGIVAWRSGRPLKITSGVGTFHRSGVSGDNTVNLAADVDLNDLAGRRNVGGGTFWLDPCLSGVLGVACSDPSAVAGLFLLPRPGELGDLEQTPIFGPSRFMFDASLIKTVRIYDVTLELRWEIFNLFNTVNFNVPTTNIFSQSFGQITRTVTNPRLMQFAAKINF